MKKLIFLIILVIIGGYLYLNGIPDFGGGDSAGDDDEKTGLNIRHISSADDLDLHDMYGGGTNYAFTYNGEEYQAIYTYDCWTIYDSYKITNKHDMKIICRALSDIHPIHGKDLESYRTPDDMAYEWQQHNLAYKYLPEDNAWRTHAENVDLDPEDQGRSIEEIYEARTGQEIDLKEKVKEKVEESIEDGTLIEKIKHYVFE